MAPTHGSLLLNESKQGWEMPLWFTIVCSISLTWRKLRQTQVAEAAIYIFICFLYNVCLDLVFFTVNFSKLKKSDKILWSDRRGRVEGRWWEDDPQSRVIFMRLSTSCSGSSLSSRPWHVQVLSGPGTEVFKENRSEILSFTCCC